MGRRLLVAAAVVLLFVGVYVGTFALRFLFFHYVLFAASVVKDPPGAAEEALASTDPGPEPFARATESDPGDDEDFER